jgi:hypothetical protein
MRAYFIKYCTAKRVHIAFAGVWVALVFPTIFLWAESVLWVAIMSCYALFIGHIASYQAAASSGVDQATHEKLNAIADALSDYFREQGHDEHADELRRTVGLEVDDEE